MAQDYFDAENTEENIQNANFLRHDELFQDHVSKVIIDPSDTYINKIDIARHPRERLSLVVPH